MGKLAKYQIAFSKTTEKARLKYQKLEKREETDKTESQEVERKLNGKQKKNVKVLCNSDLKKRVKTNDFSHLIVKGHRTKGIWYFSGYRKMWNSVASSFSPTPRNSLSVNIIRTDTL